MMESLEQTLVVYDAWLDQQPLAAKTRIDIFQDMLTLEYQEHPLSRYSVEWQPDDRHLLRVGNPRLYEHPYQSPQLPYGNWVKSNGL